jgi:uncharacterized membrane protein
MVSVLIACNVSMLQSIIIIIIIISSSSAQVVVAVVVVVVVFYFWEKLVSLAESLSTLNLWDVTLKSRTAAMFSYEQYTISISSVGM